MNTSHAFGQLYHLRKSLLHQTDAVRILRPSLSASELESLWKEFDKDPSSVTSLSCMYIWQVGHIHVVLQEIPSISS